MARLLGPDAGSRYAYLASGAPAANLPAVVYSNSAGTVLADIRAYDGSQTPGGAILGSQVTTDANGQLPLFWFPDGDVDRLWVSVNGGPVSAIDADNNARLDAHLATHAVVNEAPLSLKDPRIGAVLDGSNEAAKLTAAFALMPAAGGEILVPPGVLGLGSEVTLPLNVSLTGAGQGASAISPSAGWTGRLLSTGGANTISKLRFSGLGTSGVLLTIRKARSLFSQLHFDNSGSHAIEFVGTASNSSAHANKLTDINIEDCLGTGVLLTAWAYDNEFVNLWIGECNVGMRLQDGACFFNNLHVWGCVSHGVEVRNNYNLFQNVYIESNGTGGTGNGVDIFNSTGTQVIGGRLWKNASSGVNLGGTSSNNRFVGLDIHENGTNGITGGSVQHVQVAGCRFFDTSPTPTRQDRPIVTSGTSDFWVITGNVMRAVDHVVGGNTLVGAGNVVANNIV